MGGKAAHSCLTFAECLRDLFYPLGIFLGPTLCPAEHSVQGSHAFFSPLHSARPARPGQCGHLGGRPRQGWHRSPRGREGPPDCCFGWQAAWQRGTARNSCEGFCLFFFACNGTERICRANYQITSGNKGSVSLVRDEEIRDEELQEASLASDKEHANYTGILSSAKAVATISNLETSAPSFPSYSVTVRTLE